LRVAGVGYRDRTHSRRWAVPAGSGLGRSPPRSRRAHQNRVLTVLYVPESGLDCLIYALTVLYVPLTVSCVPIVCTLGVRYRGRTHSRRWAVPAGSGLGRFPPRSRRARTSRAGRGICIHKTVNGIYKTVNGIYKTVKVYKTVKAQFWYITVKAVQAGSGLGQFPPRSRRARTSRAGRGICIHKTVKGIYKTVNGMYKTVKVYKTVKAQFWYITVKAVPAGSGL